MNINRNLYSVMNYFLELAMDIQISINNVMALSSQMSSLTP